MLALSAGRDFECIACCVRFHADKIWRHTAFNVAMDGAKRTIVSAGATGVGEHCAGRHTAATDDIIDVRQRDVVVSKHGHVSRSWW